VGATLCQFSTLGVRGVAKREPKGSSLVMVLGACGGGSRRRDPMTIFHSRGAWRG